MPGGQFLELLLLKWSDFDNSKIAAGHFTHNYGLDRIFILFEKIIEGKLLSRIQFIVYSYKLD